MEVKLRTMDLQEFKSFYEYSINDYVNDLMKSKNASIKTALIQAQKEFSTMLPDGINTKDNSVMTIEDIDTGKSVGFIWYLL